MLQETPGPSVRQELKSDDDSDSSSSDDKDDSSSSSSSSDSDDSNNSKEEDIPLKRLSDETLKRDAFDSKRDEKDRSSENSGTAEKGSSQMIVKPVTQRTPKKVKPLKLKMKRPAMNKYPGPGRPRTKDANKPRRPRGRPPKNPRNLPTLQMQRSATKTKQTKLIGANKVPTKQGTPNKKKLLPSLTRTPVTTTAQPTTTSSPVITQTSVASAVAAAAASATSVNTSVVTAASPAATTTTSPPVVPPVRIQLTLPHGHRLANPSTATTNKRKHDSPLLTASICNETDSAASPKHKREDTDTNGDLTKVVGTAPSSEVADMGQEEGLDGSNSETNQVVSNHQQAESPSTAEVRAYWKPPNESKPLLDQVLITDVTSDDVTITVRESTTDSGFFKQRGED